MHFVTGYQLRRTCIAQVQNLIYQVDAQIGDGIITPEFVESISNDVFLPTVLYRFRQPNGTEMVYYKNRRSFYDRSLLVKRGDHRLEYNCGRMTLTLETPEYWELVQLYDTGEIRSSGGVVPRSAVAELLETLALDKFTEMTKE